MMYLIKDRISGKLYFIKKIPNTLSTMSNDINSIKSYMCKNNYPNGTTFRTTSVNTQNTSLSNMMNTRYNY